MLRYLDVQNILDKNDLILQESGCVGSENERGNTYMKKIGIVTDSHSSISQEEAEKLGIFVLPMPFYIDGECFYESVTLSRELFFEKLAAGADITTSQPSPTAVMEIWDKALEQFEKILYLPISSGLSGSYETAMMLAKDEAYEGRVLVVDDGQVAAPLHQMVLDTLDNLGLLLDLPGSRLDPGELLFVMVPGQCHPAGEITAGSAVGGQHLRRLLQAGLPAGQIILGKEAVCIGQIECQHRKILL